MTKLSSRFLTILAAVAIPAALVMVPSVAVAKKLTKRVKIDLEGPINHSKDPGYTPTSHLCCFPSYTPTIQIRAKFGGKKGSSVQVTQYGLWGSCSVREYSDGESKHEITLKPKKNGSFSGTDTEFGTNTLTVSGQIFGKKTASGTVREVEVREHREPPTSAEGTCDSGTVTWTASRVPALSEPKASYDSGLVYPAGL
jgi:hypothetical protein